jgi:hypothetical protein
MAAGTQRQRRGRGRDREGRILNGEQSVWLAPNEFGAYRHHTRRHARIKLASGSRKRGGVLVTLDEFWEHIHKTKRKDPDARAERLTARLSKLKPAEIIDFEHWWGVLKHEAYSWDLWGAAYIINGGCSDDGFTDFRSWLILHGRDVFQAALANPDSLADLKVEADSAFCECYPATSAWFAATGKDDDYDAWHAAYRAKYPKQPREPDLGDGWDFDDEDEMRKRYPRLWALYNDEETDE